MIGRDRVALVKFLGDEMIAERAAGTRRAARQLAIIKARRIGDEGADQIGLRGSERSGGEVELEPGLRDHRLDALARRIADRRMLVDDARHRLGRNASALGNIG